MIATGFEGNQKEKSGISIMDILSKQDLESGHAPNEEQRERAAAPEKPVAKPEKKSFTLEYEDDDDSLDIPIFLREKPRRNHRE